MYQPIEELEIFKHIEAMSDKIWEMVVNLPNFERITLGQQLVRAADSIGANLAEGDGRFSELDSIRFFYYARGSLSEMKYWLQRCQRRNVFPSELCKQYLHQASVLHKQLNALIKTRKENMESKHHTNHPVTQQPKHPITQSPNDLITQSPNDPATQSPSNLITQSPNNPTTQSPNNPTTQSPSNLITQSPNDPATQSPIAPSHHPLRRYES